MSLVLGHFEWIVRAIPTANSAGISLSGQGGPNPVTGLPPNTSPAEVKALFDEINVIFEQAGVKFVFAELDAAGLPRLNAVDNSAFSALYLRADTLSDTHENIHVLTLGNTGEVLNAYVVRGFGGRQVGQVGFGVSVSSARGFRLSAAASTPPLPPTQPGIILIAAGATSANADPALVRAARRLLVHTIAHELGHCLDLDHYDGGEALDALSNVRNDLWAHSNLMHKFARLEATGSTPANNDPALYNSPLRVGVGYGTSTFLTAGTAASTTLVHTGQMLSLKDRRRAPATASGAVAATPGDQVKTVRDGAKTGSYKQFSIDPPANGDRG